MWNNSLFFPCSQVEYCPSSLNYALNHLLEVIYELFPILKTPQVTVRLNRSGIWSSRRSYLSEFSFKWLKGSYIDKFRCSKSNLIQPRPDDHPALYTSVCVRLRQGSTHIYPCHFSDCTGNSQRSFLSYSLLVLASQSLLWSLIQEQSHSQGRITKAQQSDRCLKRTHFCKVTVRRCRNKGELSLSMLKFSFFAEY